MRKTTNKLLAVSTIVARLCCSSAGDAILFSFWQQDLRIEKSMDSLIIFVVLLLQLIALSPICNPMAPVRSTSCWYFGCFIPECFG